VARLELAFAARRGRTVLDRCYAEPPFRLGRIFDLDGAAYAIVVCSGPGVFGGDALRQTVHVARGARVVLTSQAALQAHPSPAGALPGAPALVHSEFVVDDEAELHCHWDAVIPFARARLDQRTELRIGARSRLYWGEATMAGRVGRGEAWRFESLAHELALRVDGSLSYLERYVLAPADRGLAAPWIAGSEQYFATALVHHPEASSDVAERWHRGLAVGGAQVAVDLVAPRLIAARLAAADGATFSRLRASIRAAALEDIFRAPELAGRK
jgi:urease accessory protein